MDARNYEVDSTLPYSMLRIFVDTSVKEIDASSADLLEMLAERNPNVKTRRKQLELDNQVFECNMFIMAFNHLQMQWMLDYQREKESEKIDEWIKRLLILSQQEESSRIDREFTQKEAQELQLLLLALSQWASVASQNADKRIDAFNEIITHIDKWAAKIDGYLIKVNSVIKDAREELKDQGMQIINQISVNQFPFINSDIYDIPKLQAGLALLHEREEKGELSPQQMVLEQRTVLENAMLPNVRAALPESERNKKLDDAADQLHQAYLPSVTKLRKAIALKERIISKREELAADRISAQSAIDHNNKIKQMSDLISKMGTQHQMGSRRAGQIKDLHQEIQGNFAETEGRHDEMIARMQKHKSGEDFLDIENELDQLRSVKISRHKKAERGDENVAQRTQDIEIKSDSTQYGEKDERVGEEKSDINTSDSKLEQVDADAEPGSSPEPAINAESAEIEQPLINEEQPGLPTDAQSTMDKHANVTAESDADTFMSELEEGIEAQQLPPKEEVEPGAEPESALSSNPPEKEHSLINEEQPGLVSEIESSIHQRADVIAESDADTFMSDLEESTGPQQLPPKEEVELGAEPEAAMSSNPPEEEQPVFSREEQSSGEQHADVITESDADMFMSELESGTDSQQSSPKTDQLHTAADVDHTNDKDKSYGERKDDPHDKKVHGDEHINPDRSQIQGKKYREAMHFKVATAVHGTKTDAQAPEIDRKDDRDDAPKSTRPRH